MTYSGALIPTRIRYMIRSCLGMHDNTIYGHDHVISVIIIIYHVCGVPQDIDC